MRQEGEDGRAARDVVVGKHGCLHEAEPETGKRKMIDEAERARRKAAVEYANGSVRLDGLSAPGTARVSRALAAERRQERAGRPRSQRANRC